MRPDHPDPPPAGGGGGDVADADSLVMVHPKPGRLPAGDQPHPLLGLMHQLAGHRTLSRMFGLG